MEKQNKKTQQNPIKKIFQTNNHLTAFDINCLNVDVPLQDLAVLKIVQQMDVNWKF